MDSRRASQPRWQVTWHCWYPLGATRGHGEKVYYVHAASEGRAIDSVRDMMRNVGVEPDGPPHVERVHD